MPSLADDPSDDNHHDLLTQLNHEREIAVASYKKWLPVGLGGGALLGLGIGVATMEPVAGGIALIVGMIAGWALARIPVFSFNSSLKERLVKRVINERGFVYSPSGGAFSLRPLKRVLPGYDRESREDYIAGDINGVDFSAVEIHLEDRRTRTDSKGRTTTYYVTVFRGRVASYDMHKAFKNPIILSTNTWDLLGSLSNVFTGLEQVKLEDPEFEKMFDTYGTDQVEARYILTPGMMERLKDIRRQHGGLEAVFDGGKIHLAISTGQNLFEDGYKGSAITRSSIAAILSDVDHITGVASQLGLDAKTKI